MRARTRPAHGWYLDLDLLERYWGAERAYHHTISSSLVYALREGLRLVAEEGLEARWERHLSNAEMLWDGLEAMGRILEENNQVPVVINTAYSAVETARGM